MLMTFKPVSKNIFSYLKEEKKTQRDFFTWDWHDVQGQAQKEAKLGVGKTGTWLEKFL